MVDGVRHVERVEAGPHPGEVGGAGLAQVVDEAGRVLGGALALGRLAVEDAQRVLLEALPVGVAELVPPLGQELAQQLEVARAGSSRPPWSAA